MSPNTNEGWTTRKMPPVTRMRFRISKTPQASLRNIQERTAVEAGLIAAIMVTSERGRYLTP